MTRDVEIRVTRGSACWKMRAVDGVMWTAEAWMECVVFGEVGLRGAWKCCHAGISGLRADKNRDRGCRRYYSW